MRKKCFTGFIALVLIVLCVGTAFAQSASYSVPDLNLSVEIPEEYLVLTEETLNDPKLEETVYDFFGVDTQTLEDYLDTQAIYLDALEIDGENEFFITLIDEGQSDMLDEFSGTNINQAYVDDLLNAEPGYIKQQMEYMQSAEASYEMGADITDVREVRTDDALYISYHASNDEFDEMHYMTVKNGQTIYFILRENGGSITPASKELMETIMQSVKIDTVDNEVSRKMAASGQANAVALIVGIILVAVVILCAYLKYKKRWEQEKGRAAQMAETERDSILRANAAEQAKYIIGRLTVLRDEGVVTQEEYERKVADLKRRGE